MSKKVPFNSIDYVNGSAWIILLAKLMDLRLAGREPQKLIQPFSEFIAFVDPDDRQFVTDTMQSAIEAHGEYDFEYRVIWPDRSVHWLHPC